MHAHKNGIVFMTMQPEFSDNQGGKLIGTAEGLKAYQHKTSTNNVVGFHFPDVLTCKFHLPQPDASATHRVLTNAS